MGTVALAIFAGYNMAPRREEVTCVYAGRYFAVHRQRGLDDTNLWQITHRPSGFAAGKRFKTRRAAIEHAEWLEKRGSREGVNWSLGDTDKLCRGKPWEELEAATQRRVKKIRNELAI